MDRSAGRSRRWRLICPRVAVPFTQRESPEAALHNRRETWRESPDLGEGQLHPGHLNRQAVTDAGPEGQLGKGRRKAGRVHSTGGR